MEFNLVHLGARGGNASASLQPVVAALRRRGAVSSKAADALVAADKVTSATRSQPHALQGAFKIERVCSSNNCYPRCLCDRVKHNFLVFSLRIHSSLRVGRFLRRYALARVLFCTISGRPPPVAVYSRGCSPARTRGSCSQSARMNSRAIAMYGI